MKDLITELKDSYSIPNIVKQLQKTDKLLPFIYEEYTGNIERLTNEHCVKLGITDPDICDNITKKCIQNEDNYENFKKEKFDITKNNIENQEICEKAWGKSIKQQINQIIKSSKLRHLLHKSIKNIDLDKPYLNTADWMNHIVPDKLKEPVLSMLGYDYSSISKDEEMINLLKYRQDIPIEDMLLTMDKSIEYIMNEFNINKDLLKHHKITDLISIAHINQKYNQIIKKNKLDQLQIFNKLENDLQTPQNRITYDTIAAQLSKDESTKLDKNLNLLRKYDRQTYTNIIEWLVYWQSYKIPLFPTILLDKIDGKDKQQLEELIKKHNEVVKQTSSHLSLDIFQQLYIDLLQPIGTTVTSLKSSREKLIQLVFNLNSNQFINNKEILQEYYKINKKNDGNEKMINLNNFIVANPSYKDKFTEIAKNTGTDNKSNYPLITVEKVDDLIYSIREYNISTPIKNVLIHGILKLLALEFDIDIRFQNYKKDLISEVIIKKEYFKTIAKIHPNDVQLLKLSYDIHHLKLIESQSQKLEATFPFGLFPMVTPMQKVLFLISNETDMDKAYAFYQAIKDDEVQTSVGDLKNIIQYYLEYLHSQGITVVNESDIKAKIKEITTFNKELVQIARSLQILTAVDRNQNASITIPTGDTMSDIKVGVPQSSITEHYLKEIKKKKGSLTDVISQLKPIQIQLYKYSEIMDFLKLIQKHYYRI